METYNNHGKNNVDKLQRKLYEKDFSIRRRPRSELEKKDYNLEGDWKDESKKEKDPFDVSKIKPRRNGMGFFGYLMVFAALFFVASVGYASYIFFFASQEISANAVDINISAPVSISAGEILSTDLIIQNNNPIPLKSVDLIVEYPNGTKSSEDFVTDLKRTRESLGTINSGQVVRKTVQSALFGEEGDSKEISVQLEYQVDGSNAIFNKKKVFNVILNAAPARVTVSGIKEVSSGQEIELIATVISNSNTELKNLMVTAVYPFGFSFVEADVEPAFSNNIWVIDSIAPNDQKVIKIKGIINGQNEEERVFKFNTGLVDQNNSERMGIVFSNFVHDILIKRPFIGLNILLNNSNQSVVAVNSGSTVAGEIVFSNNTSDTVRNLDVRLNIEGDVINEKSISGEGGFYNSSDNTLIFNTQTNSGLREIASRKEYRIKFQFDLFNLVTSGVSLNNPEVNITAKVKGDRIYENNVEEKIDQDTSRVAKVISDVFVGAYTLRSMGPFENTGPIPPKAETESTYTIAWSISNNTNDIENAVITAVLPNYIQWANKVSPTNEVYNYDENSRSFTWNVGSIPAGTGFTSSAKEIFFQVKFFPSLTQIGESPNLLRDVFFSAKDSFTGTDIKISGTIPNTRLSDDDAVSNHQFVIE